MNPYQAGQQLGTLLFGNRGSASDPGGTPSLYDAVTGSAPDGSVYYRTLTRGAQAQNAMQEARSNRAKALIQESMLASRQKLPTAIGGVYTDPNQAALIDAVLGSNSTINLGDLGKLQNPNAVQALGQAATDMGAGNFAGYNQQTALAEGKPYQPVIVNGQTMIPNGVPLGDAAFTAQATPVGQAAIRLRGAETLAAQALAGQRDARTNAINNPQPKGSASAGAAASKPAKLPSPNDIKGWVKIAFPEAVDDNGNPDPGLLGDIAQRAAQGEPLQSIIANPPVQITKPDGTTGWYDATLDAGGYKPPQAATLGDAATSDAQQGMNFNNDPRVQKLLQQKTAAVNAGKDKKLVQQRLQQEFAKLGYKQQVVGNGG